MEETKKRRGRGPLVLAIVLILGIVALALSPKSPEIAKPKLKTAQQVQECRDLIRGAEASGLVRERPSRNRLNVEDTVWAEYPASAKTGLLLALQCEAFGGDPALQGGMVVAYGYRSGKRLGILSDGVPRFE